MRAVLFLGAGVNYGSTDEETGAAAPMGAELAVRLAETFFPDELDGSEGLSRIASYVESRESRRALDQYLKRTFINLNVTEVHTKLSRLPWHSIYSTNYDLLIERAYAQLDVKDRILEVVHSERELVDHDPSKVVVYTKIHGCISRIDTPELAPVITRDDYTRVRQRKDVLFRRFVADLIQRTVIFLGYSLSDHNFDDVITEAHDKLGRNDIQRAYAVIPDAKLPDIEYWEQKRISILPLMASDFFDALASELEAFSKSEPTTTRTTPETTHDSDSYLNELEQAFEVGGAFQIKNRLQARHYYAGYPPDWSVVAEQFDAQRDLNDVIVEDYLWADEVRRDVRQEWVLITGGAGSGKSTLLRRLAYDTHHEWERPSLFYRDGTAIPFDALRQYILNAKQRVFIYIDNAATNSNTALRIWHYSKSANLPVTIISAARKNEWNHVRNQLRRVSVIEHELDRLSEKEIGNVLDKLQDNHCLMALSRLGHEERMDVFRKKADRQLLVALREATEGKEFEEILHDEYSGIPTIEAKRAYLFVCFMHQYGAPVRVGILSRYLNMSIIDIGQKILPAAEGVIIVDQPDERDEIVYKARHRVVAELVFAREASRDDNYDRAIDFLSVVDLGYPADKLAFDSLVTSSLFVSKLDAIQRIRAVYDRALEVSGRAAFVLQHYALAERKHGDVIQAQGYIEEALRGEQTNTSLMHTHALILWDRADKSGTGEARERFFAKAQEVLKHIMKKAPDNTYAYSSYVRNLLWRANNVDSPTVKHELISEALELAEEYVEKFPDDGELRATLSDVFKELDRDADARAALEKAFELDSSRKRVAAAYSRMLLRSGKLEEALSALSDALEHHVTDPRLNSLMAEAVRKRNGQGSIEERTYLRRVIDSSGASVGVVRKLAISEYVSGDPTKSAEYFDMLKEMRGRRKDNYKVFDFIRSDTGEKEEVGCVVEEITGPEYGYVKLSKKGQLAFFRPSKVKGSLRRGDRFVCQVGFNALGAVAVNLRKPG
jgi:tetratricopeptide (TPR) repeat protein